MKDLAGRQFGRLTALRRCTKNGRSAWECRCECGTSSHVVEQCSLVTGSTQSCGCRLIIPRSSYHRACRSPDPNLRRTYRIWVAMRDRCEDPKNDSFPRYGGRGIGVCERWGSFVAFLEDMGVCPAGLSIDRVNNGGNYEPGNCRWATKIEQNRNTSRTRLNLDAAKQIVAAKQRGESDAAVAARFGVSRGLIHGIATGAKWRDAGGRRAIADDASRLDRARGGDGRVGDA